MWVMWVVMALPGVGVPRLVLSEGAAVGSVCPSCGRYDDSVYVRFGGVPVCRACFVTEVLLGSWLGLEPDLSSLLSSSFGSSSVGSGSILLWR